MSGRSNNSLGEIAKNTGIAAVGLVTYGVGLYLTINAGIGVAPWDCFYLGISKVTGVIYGNISVTIGFIVIVIDWILKERIGIGTIIDAIIVGKTVDLCNYIGIINEPDSMWVGIGVMLIGLVLEGTGQFIYMGSALGCGPFDGLMVALSKRWKKVTIGMIGIMLNAFAFVGGWILGGPIGIGTIISVLLMSPIMEAIFRLLHFEAESVTHQDIFKSIRVISGRSSVE